MAENSQDQQPQAETPKVPAAEPVVNPRPVRLSIPDPGISEIVRQAGESVRLSMPTIVSLGKSMPNIAAEFAKSNRSLLNSISSISPSDLTSSILPRSTVTISRSEPELPNQSRQLEELNQTQSRELEKMNKRVTDLRVELEQVRKDAATQAKTAADEVLKLVQEARSDLKDQKKSVQGLGAEIEKNQLKLVETLGLFVAIFGFIAISATALKDVQNPHVLGGGLIIAAGLIMSFVVVLDLIVRRWHYDLSIDEVGWKKTLMRWVVPQGIILAFVIGLLLWGANMLSEGNREIKDAAKAAAATEKAQVLVPATTVTSAPATPSPSQAPAAKE
jgi:hypothetical protein